MDNGIVRSTQSQSLALTLENYLLFDPETAYSSYTQSNGPVSERNYYKVSLSVRAAPTKMR